MGGGGGEAGSRAVPQGAEAPSYLPVTVPTARTEPLGWKPAERAGS